MQLWTFQCSLPCWAQYTLQYTNEISKHKNQLKLYIGRSSRPWGAYSHIRASASLCWHKDTDLYMYIYIIVCIYLCTC